MKILLVILLALGLTADVARAQRSAPQPDTVYVDVRTPAEFAAGHVKGAVLIPVELLQQRWRELERYRARHIVLYCRSGRRAGVALEFLKQQGFKRIENGGGLEQMAARGLPIVTGR